MKIAYLITAYNNPKHLNALINALNSPDCSFFIHIDKKSKYTFLIPERPNVYVLKETLSVYWGGFSFIQAVLRLIHKAQSVDTFDYFVLVSGTDYPVKSNTYIKDFLIRHNGEQFINISKMPENNKPFHRVDYYYVETEYNLHPVSFVKRSINRLIRLLGLKRQLPAAYSRLILYGGSNWWALTSSCVNYILKFIDENPAFVKFFHNTLIPEEMFFHTIIGNSPFKNTVLNSFVYADWRGENLAHPFLISEKHLPVFEKEEFKVPYGNKKAHLLFARKFSDTHTQLLQVIDTRFRT